MTKRGAYLYDEWNFFAMHTPKGTQAGLSWITILKQRFNVEVISQYPLEEWRNYYSAYLEM